MKKSAFSLIEISIVLIIIGVLATGIMQGTGLMKAARLASARSITSKSTVSSISGLVVWYETSLKTSFKNSETNDGNQTTEWYDISPSSVLNKKNKLTRTASASVKYAESGINKIPSLLFDGAGNIGIADFYQGSSAQATIFIVFQPLAAPGSSAQILLDSHSSQATNSIGIKAAAANINSGSSVDTSNISNPASFSTGGNYVGAFYFNRTSSAVYVNDAKNIAGGANLSPGNNQLNGLTIGTDKSSANGFSGMISEVIIYNRPLQLQERKDVMSYLAKKYKISVTNL